MGKQNKGWAPPDEDVIVEDTAVEQEPKKWTPPESDTVEGPKKKDESSLASSSASPTPGTPSKPSTEKSTSTERKKYQRDPSVGKWTNLFRELVHDYNTPLTEKEKAEKEPDPLLNAIKRGSNLAKQAGIVGPFEGKPEEEEIKTIADLQKKSRELKGSDAYQKFNASETFGDAISNFVSDPAKIVVELTAESMSSLVQYGATRVAVGAAAGSVIPVVGTAGGAVVGMADTSLGLEFTGSFLESLEEAGIDTTDPVKLQQAFQDDELISSARSHAFKKGIPIALFDLVSGGIAGKIVSKPAKSLIGKIGKGAIELAVQSMMGSGGELAGQVVAGEKINPAAILGEALGEFATSPVEVAMGAAKSAQKVVQEQSTNTAPLDQKAEVIQDKVEAMEDQLISGKAEVTPIINEETQVAPSTDAPVAEAVSEDQAQEKTEVQTDQEVSAPADTTVTQDVADVNIPQTKYIAEEESGAYDFGTTNQPQDDSRVQTTDQGVAQAIPEGNEQSGSQRTGEEENGSVSPVPTQPDQEISGTEQEITFDKTFRGPSDTGGLKGIPPKNQFKLNQGEKFERVQIILDDAQAELYQQGARAKKNASTSTDPANQDAINFSNRINQIARENRERNKEVVLDFRKKESGTELRPSTGSGVSQTQNTPPVVSPSANANAGIVESTDNDQSLGSEEQLATDGSSSPVSSVGSAARQESAAQGSQAPPPVPPGSTTQTESLAPTPQERKTYTRIKNDPDISDTIKQGIAQEAKEYIPRSLKKVTSKEADAIIDAKGLDESTKMYLDDNSEIHPDVDTAIGIKLFDRLQTEGNTADAIRVFEKLAVRGTELGQAINAYKLMQGKTMIGLVNKSIQKARKNFREKHEWRSQDARKAIDKINVDAVEKVLKSPKVQSKITSEIKKGNVKKAIDFLEGLKIDTKGKALDVVYGVSAAAWNTVITAVQKGLQAGLTISQAINKAVNTVKEPAFQKAAAVSYLDEKLKDYRVTLDPAKAIKAELASYGQKIDDIIRQHYSDVATTKASLIDKLVKDGNVAADQAQAVADELSTEFDRLTRATKEKALNRLLPKPSKNISKKERKDTVDQLIEQSNIGALSEDQYSDTITDKLGVPKLTEQQLKDVQALTDNVQKAKGDTAKSKAAQDLLNYVENLKGWSWLDAVEAIWYANMLSGPTTWAITNPFANLTNLLMEVAIDVGKNPKGAGLILGRVAAGLNKGLLQAGDVLKTGYNPFKGQDYKTEVKPVLERIEFKGGKINPLNYLKYVTRAMKAGDILFYQAFKEQRIAVLALQEARENGRTKPNKADMHNLREQLIKEDYDTALERASAEGFTGRQQKIRAHEILENIRPEYATKDAENFAASGTFNKKPTGFLGQVADALNYVRRKLRITVAIVPFVNTIMNVANEYLNYNPVVGGIRYFRKGTGWGQESFKRFTPEERARIGIKTVIGTVSMLSLFLLDNPDDEDNWFEITADGTGDTQQNYELERTGWKPYSVRIGKTWFGYKNTPLALPFATVGFFKDAQRYRRKPDLGEEAVIMGVGSLKFMMDQSTLSGLSDFFSIFSGDDISQYQSSFKKILKTLEKTLKAVVVPNYFTQISKVIQELTGSPTKRASDLGDSFIRDAPVLRDNLDNLYDAFGDPVIPKQLEKFIPLNTHRTPEDAAMFEFLKENKLFVGKPSPQNLKPNGTPMTDEEYNKWSLNAARATKKRLLREYRMYTREKNKEVINEWFDEVKKEERKSAKYDTFGFF